MSKYGTQTWNPWTLTWNLFWNLGTFMQNLFCEPLNMHVEPFFVWNLTWQPSKTWCLVSNQLPQTTQTSSGEDPKFFKLLVFAFLHKGPPSVDTEGQWVSNFSHNMKLLFPQTITAYSTTDSDNSFPLEYGLKHMPTSHLQMKIMKSPSEGGSEESNHQREYASLSRKSQIRLLVCKQTSSSTGSPSSWPLLLFR